MKLQTLTLSTVTATLLASTGMLLAETNLDPIVVGADFREQNLSQVTTSISIIGEDKIYDQNSRAFIETIGYEPNINFSAGASKAKYIQIRGIGERSQFTTPINPSVGIMVDGIDFSQNALGVTLFDVHQVEVLRGPQGTTFGVNGMAGVINVESHEPTKELGGHVEGTVGNYNTKAAGLVINAPIIEDTLLSRFSVYKNSSDGYMHNTYLGRKDTNGINELTARGKFKWFATENHTVDLTLMHVNIDNGYDAFALDNTRETHSDQPGNDTQKTNAFALKSTYQLSPKMHLVSSLSGSKSELEYSYDEDWSYDGEFDPDWAYSSFDQYLRDRKQVDVDVRLVSDKAGRIFNGKTDWTVGAYYEDYSEGLTRNYTYLDTPFMSDYDTKNQAIYGQLDTHLSDKLTLVTGLRLEKWDLQYSDNQDVVIETDEVLGGGKLGLNYQADAKRLYYVTLSKGYKPGGVNADYRLTSDAKTYQTENLWNLDLGVNSAHLNNTLKSRLNLFYGKRIDQQVKSSVTSVREDNSVEFIDYLANAAKGTYYGLESQLDYYPTDALHLYSAVGLLKATFDEYNDPNPDALDVNGRTPAHSPSYQYTIGVDYLLTDAWTVKTNVEGKSAFYFSNRHNEKSDPYALLNISAEYTDGVFTANFWARNITNEDYYVRGFGSFGNNPAKFYETERYTQLGTPRTIGVTLSYDF